jgi:hypothetical protein
VKRGSPIADIIDLKRLAVEGFANIQEYSPAELAGRPMQVEVHLPRGRTVRVDGKVTYVSPEVEAAGDFLIRAEIENQQAQGVWLLRPGLRATLTIALDEEVE